MLVCEFVFRRTPLLLALYEFSLVLWLLLEAGLDEGLLELRFRNVPELLSLLLVAFWGFSKTQIAKRG